MTSFKDREKAFETRFAQDAEMQFRAEARRNRSLGHWAAAKMGKADEEAAAYAREVVKADFEEAGDEDVFRKVSADLGDLATEAEIRAKMTEFLAQAKAQIVEET